MMRPNRTYKVKTDVSHPLAPARFMITRNGVVFTGKDVDVHQSDWYIRDGVGKCRCTLCNRSIDNIARARQKHLDSALHRRNLEKRGTP
jgi:hypothetical protein